MAHYVTCKYCGIRFDRDIESAIEVSYHRYAHKTCAEKIDATIPQEEKDYNIFLQCPIGIIKSSPQRGEQKAFVTQDPGPWARA